MPTIRPPSTSNTRSGQAPLQQVVVAKQPTHEDAGRDQQLDDVEKTRLTLFWLCGSRHFSGTCFLNWSRHFCLVASAFPRRNSVPAPVAFYISMRRAIRLPRRIFERGRPGGNRTPNLRFWRPPLCQLSYWPRLKKPLPNRLALRALTVANRLKQSRRLRRRSSLFTLLSRPLRVRSYDPVGAHAKRPRPTVIFTR